MSGHEHDHDGVGPPVTTEVADGVFAYVQPDGSWWINNTGFVTSSRSVVAIDTCSTEKRSRALLAAIDRVSKAPLRILVNTHSHGDHTNGNCLATAATVIGHEACRRALVGSSIGGLDAVFGPVEWGDLEVVPPEVTFADRLDVYAGDLRIELHFIGGPAHTTGDVVAWIPERSVLFAGDLLFNGGTPFVLMGSVAGALTALERVRSFGADTIVPGHGGVCTAAAIEDVAGYLRFVQRTATDAKAGGLSPLDAARETDLGPYVDLLDRERIVGNLYRAYSELDGAPLGSPIDLVAAFRDMIVYNGGQPLRCLA